MAEKKRWKDRLKRLKAHCERNMLSTCYDYYEQKLLANKAQNVSFNILAWNVYSDYLLITKSTKGICTCVTCGVKKKRNDSDMHPGHFRKQGDSAFLKYVDNNVRPQCQRCNVMLDGNLAKYTLFMLDEFDEEYVRYLLECKDIQDYKLGELEEKVVEWRNVVRPHLPVKVSTLYK